MFGPRPFPKALLASLLLLLPAGAATLSSVTCSSTAAAVTLSSSDACSVGSHVAATASASNDFLSITAFAMPADPSDVSSVTASAQFEYEWTSQFTGWIEMSGFFYLGSMDHNASVRLSLAGIDYTYSDRLQIVDFLIGAPVEAGQTYSIAGYLESSGFADAYTVMDDSLYLAIQGFQEHPDLDSVNTPEPSSVILLGSAVLAIGVRRARRPTAAQSRPR